MDGTTPRSAAVIGAGISGLAVAAMLADDGWRVEVHERWPRIKSVGTGIGLWPDAMRVLDRVGVGASLRAIGVPMPGGSIRAPDGRVLVRLRPELLEKRFGGAVLLVSRERILTALAERARAAGVAIHLSSTPDIVPLAEDYDVVIGADGISSTVRRDAIGGRDPQRSSGFWTIRGTDERTLTPYAEFWGDRQLFGVTPIESGATNWFAAVRTDRRPSVADLRTWYAGWPEPVGALLKQAGDDAVLCHEVHHVWPVPRTYVRDTFVLVGDAAHAMPPNLGHGGAQALLDVAALVDELRDDAVRPALRAYDRRRRRASRNYVAASVTAARLGLAGGRAARVRDRALRLLPS